LKLLLTIFRARVFTLGMDHSLTESEYNEEIRPCSVFNIENNDALENQEFSYV